MFILGCVALFWAFLLTGISPSGGPSPVLVFIVGVLLIGRSGHNARKQGKAYADSGICGACHGSGKSLVRIGTCDNCGGSGEYRPRRQPF